MIPFRECLIGKFDNQQQSLQYPSRFARILICHEDLGNGWIKGFQAYHHNPKPYREFRMWVTSIGEKFLVQNFDSEGLTYKEGYDTIFEWRDDHWHGQSHDTDYFTVDAILGKDKYYVLDKGDTWGSQWGHFKFHKLPA
tara:strand:+ start:268 stop:684 length:417 start_codon:yes stop_codon:yes gene_type:complete